MATPEGWEVLASADDLERSGQLVVFHERHELLLFWNKGEPTALSNVCIHKGRKLNEGVMLGTRLVCAGHQWAYEITTGHCAARDRYQPCYAVEVLDGEVHVQFPPKRRGPAKPAE